MNRKELFLISVTIFLTIIAWVIIEAYKVESAIQTEKKETSFVGKKIELDVSVLKDLKNKKNL